MKHLGTKTIETPRLILRKFTLADAEQMYENWASDPEVAAFLTWTAHKNSEETKAILSSWIPLYQKDNFYNWAMVLKQSGEVIGNVSVVSIDEEVSEAAMGYCMGRAYWGQGIMPEALTAVMNFLFDEVGFERVSACHDHRNAKSGRVMQKVGMTYEGTLRRGGKSTSGICDKVCYAVLRGDRNN